MHSPTPPSDKNDPLARLLDGPGMPFVQPDVSLAEISRWKVGGRARFVAEPASTEETAHLLQVLREEGVPHTVIGDMSNILFDDAGFDGVLVRIGRRMSRLEFAGGGLVRAQAGVWVPGFVRNVINRGLAGCVHAIGIPGTIGGLVVMNGGSQRKGIGDQLLTATRIRADGEVETVDRDACGFAYRTSAFQEDGSVVVEASFRYEAGDRSALRREAIAILVERRLKFPKKLPNCGSVFLSDPKLYATVGPPGHAFEQAGLKGLRLGNAQISPLHANFVVNLGGASSADVLGLIRIMRERVIEATGVALNCEVRHLAPDGRLRMAHIAAEEVNRG